MLKNSTMNFSGFILCFALLILGSGSLFGQVSGTKTIPTDYATIAAFITDINTNGIGSGGVTLNVPSGYTETAPAGGFTITATGTVADPIIIQGTGGAPKPVITASGALTSGALNDGIIKLIGSDYVTISGLDLRENAANTTTAAASNNMTEFGIALFYNTTTDGCQNVTITDNTISLGATYQNAMGIYANSTHNATNMTTGATATTGNNNNLTIRRNTISSVNLGIVVLGPTAAADHASGLTIGGASGDGNSITFGLTGTFSGFSSVSGTVNGILVRNVKNTNCSYNTLASNGTVTAGTLNGIQLQAFSNTPTGTFSQVFSNNTFNLLSAAVGGSVVGITSPSGSASATSTLDMSNNQFNGFGHSVASPTGTLTFISTVSTNLTTTISNNSFNNLTVTTTGSVTFVSHSFTIPSGGSTTISNNTIGTQFTKSGAGGTVTLTTTNGSSQNGTTATYANNNFSNINLTGGTTFTGFNNTDGTGSGTSTKSITGNTINNLTGGTSSITLLNVSYFNGISAISGNTFTNVTGQGSVTGMSINASLNTANPLNVTSNTIFGLSSTGTGGAVVGITSSNTSPVVNISNNDIHGLSSTGASLVSAIGISGGTMTNVNANRIYTLSSSNAGGTVFGVSITSGAGVNVSNNIISGLTAPVASGTDVIRGININSSSTGAVYGVYYNSVYLSGTSSGANFGTSGIYHQVNATATIAALDMRNNIIVNETTPVGTGIAVAFRRSGVALNNYASTSNRNLFYAGTPSATRLIMYDGTTSYQTLLSYQAAVAPRDANSITGEAAFTGAGYGTAGNFFISLTGSSSDFLRPVAGIVTQVEGGASPVASPSITTDFTGTTRPATPDMGAYEFAGTTPAPVITLNSVTPPTTTQCVATARLVSVNITTSAGTITGATIGYSVNGVPQTNIVMTNVSGSTWEGTIPVPTPSNATIAWGVAATNSLGINSGYTGTTYFDDPLFGSTAGATASSSSICVSSSTNLTASLIKTGTVVTGNASGTSSSSGISPFYHGYGGVKTQYIYRASELTAMGLSAGNITSLSLNITSLGTTTMNSFTINVGHTAQNAAVANTAIVSGLTQVYSNAAQTLTTGTNNYVFSTPFNWDGVSNIVISFNYSNVNTGGSSSTVTTDASVAFISSLAIYADNASASCLFTAVSSGQACMGTSSNTTTSTRPAFTIAGNKAPAVTSVSWSDGVGTVGTTNPLTVSPTATTTYTATITAAGCSVSPSPTVTVTVNPLPSTPIAANSTQCGTQVPTASVTSTSGLPTPTFMWYDAAVAGTVLQSGTSTTYTTAISATATFYVSELNTVTGCESARVPVTVTVSTPDAISASTSAAAICLNGSVNLTAANTNPTPVQNYTYSWVSTAGSGAETPVAGNPVTITPTVVGSYTYTVTAVDGGCVTTNTVSVTVNANPAANTAGVSDNSICNGELVNLTSSLPTTVSPLIQDFNSGLGTWTTTYNGTAPATTGFGIQNAPYSYTTYFSNFATPNGGGFAMSNADMGSSGNKTRTTLVSPVFSTAGMTSGTLTFQNLYRKWNSGDSLVRLEISTDGGTTWSTLKDYLPLGSQGVVTDLAQVPANESIALTAPYLNQPNMRIRFNYVSAWGYYWIIDDVNLTGTSGLSLAWTSSPAGFTSSSQNPTGVAPTVSTTYTITATNGAGCTSTASVAVTVNQPSSSSVTVTACDSYTWAQNNSTYTSSGAYTAVVSNAVGCDSTITLNLTINNSTAATVTQTACGSYTWPINNATYTASGTHTATISNALGCDSVITLNLTINNPTSATVNQMACQTYTWPVNNTTYTTSGVYTGVLTNALGCDSVITLNLTIGGPSASSVSVMECSSYTWAQNGMTYAASGAYTDTITNMFGCDSVITLNLIINQPSASSVSVTECSSYTWAQNGMTYTASGMYTDTISNSVGCDSVITLDLTINMPTSSMLTVSTCSPAYTWAQNGMTYTTSGMYNDTISNAIGCDSIITLDLTITPFVATATDNGDATITASAGTTYQWINCTTNTPIAGATAQTFAPAANGTYAVVVSNGTCSDTSNCVTIANVGIKEHLISIISVHPNPTHDVVIITMDAASAVVEVMDVQGKLVQTTQIKSGDPVDLSAYERGVYTLRIKTDAGTSIERIVKN
ncbi:T9SS type A sorting domain-containing protein [Fluviicola chungangensis]|uniref:T9SS type A sorting domain-containing protein n=1 Tax=Fluviicola chungangensis TaxID=2597671 RepID=A0A556MYJ5_9FLAO|nr:T9SS type A sorting domain-containing protein [Fluviicola chungangensis]TSJ44991.1 T9SS type A sorting domain-containing protein [Fluviicola chungangensis]